MKSKKRNTFTSYLVITAGTMIMAAGIYLFKFPNNFSTGGVSALSMILAALFPGMTAGQYMMIINVILLAIGLLVFGKGFAVKTIDGINLSKCFTIITDKDAEICEFINKELHRGATVSVCSGSFSGADHKMIITVLNRGQAVMLKHFIKEIDPHAFTMITNSSDILGKGFRMTV